VEHNRVDSTQDPNHILHGLEPDESEYDPLHIPGDWELARKHALARRTAPDTKDEDTHAKRTKSHHYREPRRVLAADSKSNAKS
jgi:hypothetical protein